jgi:hypothetical protein
VNILSRRVLLAISAIALASVLSACTTIAPGSSGITLEERAATARTPADHQEVASLYEQQAGADREAAQRHARMANSYLHGPRPDAGMATHCKALSDAYSKAAEENIALAKRHREFAALAK